MSLKRDMSDREFKAALARNGFAPAGDGIGSIWFVDKTGISKVWIGASFRKTPFRILRRETLRRLIQHRADEAKRADAAKRKAAQQRRDA
ncbi:MAG TPA: hypothetical protein VGG48_01680 [Rhizomicrobium sp.]|jgi:hypothetical protein